MNKILPWIARLVAAVILLQTLFYKFSGAEESVYIFSQLHAEPWGRIGSGIMELIASVLILIPKTTAWGALLGVGIMGGAILSHIFVLGPVVRDDGGLLFIYAILVFISCLYLVWIYRKSLPVLNKI
ncbi:MAG: DoxX family protein [Bacteroidetes bacterium]|nr:DoxX family protein [Bacteroidota bacterium]MBS1608222.1 DoxX family protein [Bacteroidota bacterium]